MTIPPVIATDADITVDGARYLASTFARVARPFHYRWLIPALCKTHVGRWKWSTRLSLAALAPLIWWYVGGWRGLAAIGLLAGFAGVVRFNLAYPVLVDAPAMAAALACACLVRQGWWWAAIPVALLAGTIRETSPIFAAAFAWSPLPLIGLASVAIRHCQRAGPDPLDAQQGWVLAHPFQASRQYHQGFEVANWVLPWGMGILCLAAPSWQLAVVCALAYSQVLVATDTVRLYQWAWPVVALCAVDAVPLRWLPVIVVLHVANPFHGTGG